jgi:hypothetical protein
MHDQPDIPLDEELIIQASLEELSRKLKEMMKETKKRNDKKIKKLNEISHIFAQVSLLINLDNHDYVSAYNSVKSILREDREKGTNYLLEILNKYPTYKKEIAKSLTSDPKVKQKGRTILDEEKETPHYYRNFMGDREKQILRHIATQVYLALKIELALESAEKAKNLVEVQVMHVYCNNRHNIFIAANKAKTTNVFANFVSRDIKTLLTRAYADNNEEGARRSKRYASKLKNRIFEGELKLKEEAGFEKDSENAKAVGKILQTSNVSCIKIRYKESNSGKNKKLILDENSEKEVNDAINQSNNIYFIDISDYQHEKRHAEEFLCDIAEYIRKQQTELYSCIAGKKRPCIGCSARLKSAEISKYGKSPGRFWSNTIENKTAEDALETIKLLDTGTNFTSYCKDNEKRAEGYDSGSDSSSPENKEEDNNSVKKRCRP